MTSSKKHILRTLTLLSSIIFYFGCSDKNNDDNKLTNQIVPLVVADTTIPAKFDIRIMLGCGAGGVTSPEFIDFEKLIADKNYAELKSNLDSSDLKQLLSVIALDDLSDRKLVTLTQDEKEIITKVKSSQKTYTACQGCGGDGYSGKISDMFANKPQGVDWSNVLYNIKFHIGLVKPADT
ncbi:MAG: hypothetical protein KBG47_02710 [Bacteroidia bacterium]|nr:hypothetical protein [Bacteroidia bacterium]